MAKLTTNAMIRADPRALEAYQGRREVAVARFDELGWGYRSRCSRDLRLAPSSISSVLTGGRISAVTLALIEDWLDLLEE